MRIIWIYIGLACAAQAEIDFDRDIRPILSDNCFHCHGPDTENQKADLRLDTQEGATSPHKDGWTPIVPRDLKNSHAFTRMTTKDPDELMPPPDSNRSLSKKEIQLIKQWIEEGANWSEYWAYLPPKRPKTPDAAPSAIDVLINKGLQNVALSATDEASKRTLIRRVSLDLTGLPPTPKETQAFLADDSANAYERVVDRLLASPHYGERMAWPWLDAARYADTNGYQGDRDRTMWPWRDWVVGAFNKNLPFDQFTIWQIAGDLLPNATQEQKLATGFLRNHMINGEGGRIPEENRVEYVFDQLETVGTNWLGLTFNCCRCHDHKYDALSHVDYFSFFAFFNQSPINGGGKSGQTAPVLAFESPAQIAKRSVLAKQLQMLSEQQAQHKKNIHPQQIVWEEKQRQSTAAPIWIPLTPDQIKGTSDQTLTIEPNGTILTSGSNPKNDTYTLTIPLHEGQAIGALKLDAIQHPSMTKGGLARSNSGNFVLTDFKARIRTGSEVNALTFSRATASFEQGSLVIKNAIDNNKTSGWAVWNGKTIDQNHHAVFYLPETISAAAGTTLEITLAHDSKHAHHNLGYFQLSANPSTKATAAKSSPLTLALATPREKRNKKQKTLIDKSFLESDKQWSALQQKKTASDKELKDLAKSLPKVMIMADGKPRKTYILDKGLYNQTRAEVTAAVPAKLPPLPPGAKADRLGLAKWLVAPENPLTARVIVNRLWAQTFGIGLVKTTENFGIQGERPVNQELLDWLAVEFRESGWDVKALMKQMVMSQAYRRASIISPESLEKDPDNRYLSRGPRYRMPSWMIRDQALSSSGLLVNKAGGPGVKPYQPDGVWAEMTFGGGKKHYKRDSGDKLYRRSLYTFWRRIVGPTMFFDASKRQTCEVKPLRTNTPLHALAVLNDDTYVEAGRSLANHLITTQASDDARIDLAFQRTLARPPKSAESAIIHQSLTRLRKQYRDAPELAKAYLTVGEFKGTATDPGELASWATVCLTLLNLDEALSRE